MGTPLLKRAELIANIIKKSRNIHIVTHIDADGIAAGAIASETLRRLGIEYSLECVKQLDDIILNRLIKENHELVWFTDLGSSISKEFPEINKIITDHHSCPLDSNFSNHLNPHLFNLEGSYDISGAGTTFLVSKCIDKNNIDLSSLAIIGACGDQQDRNQDEQYQGHQLAGDQRAHQLHLQALAQEPGGPQVDADGKGQSQAQKEQEPHGMTVFGCAG